MGQSVLESMGSTGSMMPSASFGGLPSSSENKMQVTSESFASRFSKTASMASLRSAENNAKLDNYRNHGGNALARHRQALEAQKQRERQKALDRPVHLRPNPSNPLDSGCLRNYETQQARALKLPLQMATQPKWSTDLKGMN